MAGSPVVPDQVISWSTPAFDFISPRISFCFCSMAAVRRARSAAAWIPLVRSEREYWRSPRRLTPKITAIAIQRMASSRSLTATSRTGR
jgi:hypothetical protein